MRRIALCAAAPALLALVLPAPGLAQAAKSTECTKIGLCYCVSADLKPVIDARVAHFRQVATEQRKAVA